MNNEDGKQKKKVKVHVPTKVESCDTCPQDAWKMVCFIGRTMVAATSGRVIGDVKFDEAMGTAFAEVFPPQEICKRGKQYDIAMHGLSGAWKAVKGDK